MIATAGTRTRIWTLLLLGNNYEVSDMNLVAPTMPCDEQHVLEADVHRTRANMEEFRSTSWRYSVTIILQSFCLKHNIQYKQGMNEVCNLSVYLSIQIPGTIFTYLVYLLCNYRMYLNRS